MPGINNATVFTSLKLYTNVSQGAIQTLKQGFGFVNL
jgi:hypothetical protein